jgi:hypothetical protein
MEIELMSEYKMSVHLEHAFEIAIEDHIITYGGYIKFHFYSMRQAIEGNSSVEELEML